jgi:hypothetical protein
MKIKTQIILSVFFAMAISSLQALPAISSGNATDTDNNTNITNAKLQQSSGILVDNKALNDSKIKSGVEAEIAELKEAKLTSGNSNLKNNVIDGSKAKATGKKAEIGNSIIVNINSDVNNTAVKESTSNSGINLGGQQ